MIARTHDSHPEDGTRAWSSDAWRETATSWLDERLAEAAVEREAEPADIERMRDAYLAPFAGLAPPAELVEALELACRVGKVARALTWQRAVGGLAADGADERFASGPFESMASLLEDTWLGRA